MTNRLERNPTSTGGGHLVVKRGHHGRYRFAMMTAHGRIKGEVQVDVQVDVASESRATLQARALAGISSVVDDVSAAVAARIAAGQIEACYPHAPVPTRGTRITGCGARKGAHRGQI